MSGCWRGRKAPGSQRGGKRVGGPKATGAGACPIRLHQTAARRTPHAARRPRAIIIRRHEASPALPSPPASHRRRAETSRCALAAASWPCRRRILARSAPAPAPDTVAADQSAPGASACPRCPRGRRRGILHPRTLPLDPPSTAAPAPRRLAGRGSGWLRGSSPWPAQREVQAAVGRHTVAGNKWTPQSGFCALPASGLQCSGLFSTRGRKTSCQLVGCQRSCATDGSVGRHS